MAALLIVLFLDRCETVGDWVEEETDVTLSEVPETVLETVRRAVPGIVFTSAEIEREQGRVVFDLEG